MSEPLVFIYADESCLGNQFKGRARPGGAAGLVEYFHPERGWVRRDFWVSEPDTTNNRMAIRSAALPLAALRSASRVVFTSDSRYLVDGMTQWVHGWAARGWKRKDGEIENLALWKELLGIARRHQVQWRWVKGHAVLRNRLDGATRDTTQPSRCKKGTYRKSAGRHTAQSPLHNRRDVAKHSTMKRLQRVDAKRSK
jgi:ribonuclease HI